VRVLFLTIGPEAEPSSRFRVYQYLEPLRSLGIEAEVRPRVGHAYFELGFGLRRPAAPLRIAWVAGSAAGRTLRRLRDLFSARHFDVVVVQKETFPFGMSRLVDALGLRVVYDFDDAVYARPAGTDGLGRGLRCRAVLAGNEVLADYARGHSDRVQVLPTVVDTDAYPVRPVRRSGRLCIGWIGAPANVVYLEPLRPVFAELSRRHDVRLLLRGPDAFACPGTRVELRGWRTYASRSEEADDLRDIDVGIMPLPEQAFAAGKCALKAIQYMASGIPVVASPVGANREVVVDGETGYLASTPEAWLARLSELLSDPELRATLGRAGRARAEQRYSIRSAVPRLAAALRSAAL
jgi:glycosyltransferase involved in cell wall biosynthesis